VDIRPASLNGRRQQHTRQLFVNTVVAHANTKAQRLRWSAADAAFDPDTCRKPAAERNGEDEYEPARRHRSDGRTRLAEERDVADLERCRRRSGLRASRFTHQIDDRDRRTVSRAAGESGQRQPEGDRKRGGTNLVSTKLRGKVRRFRA